MLTPLNARDVIVIGSGLGGLTAAALLARAGKSVLVLEKNAHPGGAATTLDRDGIRHEMSLHMTVDPASALDPKGKVFEALGLDERVEFVPVPDLYELRTAELDAPFVLPKGLEAAEAALATRFPGAAEAISGFFAQLSRTQEAMGMLSEHHDGRWWRGHLADLPADFWALMRDFRKPLSAVLERHFGDNEALKLCLAANLPYYAEDPAHLWWLGYAVAQGGYLAGGGSYIRGGSARLAEALVEEIRAQGGQVLCGHTVSGLVTGADGAVTGVRYSHGGHGTAETAARAVIANAAPHALVDMLPEAAATMLEDEIEDRPLSLSLFHLTLTLDRPGAAVGIRHYSTALLPDWMTRLGDWAQAGDLLAATPGDRMPPVMVVDYGQIDAGLGDGPAPVTVTGIDRLTNWEGLDADAYAERKAAWVAALVGRLEDTWPGIAAAVTGAEMATARTMAHYLGTPGGALYGFAPEPPVGLMSGPPMQVQTSVPGLFLGSAFSGFGGYSGAMGGGMGAARAALKYLG